MAISKKYSRRIVVDGVAYRWRIPPEVEYDQTAHDGHLIVNVWPEKGAGQTLRLYGGLHPMRERATASVVITPRRVADAIRAALRAGWTPMTSNQLFRLDILPTDEP
ncbi:hypothetical protein [Frigoriglobus tundricola]|uniref:hypothetical protein n=1 Tax=Frigoriglobus tundricola TaxID=2774151 RepID=UPI00148ECDDE|nr:hypothetical protein [Frigoriglobus tundricola]